MKSILIVLVVFAGGYIAGNLRPYSSVPVLTRFAPPTPAPRRIVPAVPAPSRAWMSDPNRRTPLDATPKPSRSY